MFLAAQAEFPLTAVKCPKRNLFLTTKRGNFAKDLERSQHRFRVILLIVALICDLIKLLGATEKEMSEWMVNLEYAELHQNVSYKVGLSACGTTGALQRHLFSTFTFRPQLLTL